MGRETGSHPQRAEALPFDKLERCPGCNPWNGALNRKSFSCENCGMKWCASCRGLIYTCQNNCEGDGVLMYFASVGGSHGNVGH